MADTQTAPQPATQPPQPPSGSVSEAQEALLGLLEPEEENPVEEEAAPTEEEESTEETQDESLEEESEEELEASAEEETEESDDEDEEEPDVYAVNINGEEHEVSFDELLKGYSRQSDYTKKTQELSEHRKAFDNAKQYMAQEYQQIQAERQQYIDSLQQIVDSAAPGLEQYASINWEQLKAEDPIAFITKKEEFRDAQDNIANYQAQQEEVYQRQYQDYQKQAHQTLQKEHMKMAEVLPDWKEPEKQKQISKDIKEYALSVGYTPQEIGSLADHRSLLVLMKAQKYDSLQKADIKSKKLKNKPKVVRSGKGKSKSNETKVKKAAQMKRLQGTGHIDDASALLEDFIDI
jgi:hypothetical protein